MIAKLNLGWFNFRIIHIHFNMLEFYEPNIGKYGNGLKTQQIRRASHISRLDKKVTCNNIKLITTKRRGHHNSLKPITVGP
jgi:hypothetical protein